MSVIQSAVPQQLTVVQVIPDLESSGACESVVQVADALVQQGHRSIVVSEGGRREADIARIGASFIRLPVASRSPSLIASNGRRLAALAIDEGVDLLHAQSRGSAWSCLLAGKLASIPYVATCDNSFRAQNPLKRLYNSAMVRGARVIALGERLARVLEERYHTPRERIAVVDRGIDLAEFEAGKVPADRVAALARNWKIAPGERVVLLPGRLSRRKGAHVLVAAAQRLREAGLKNFVCVVVGEEQRGSRYGSELWDRVHQSELSEFVRIVGHCTDMPAAYALSEIAISAVLAPGGPQRAMLEAQAMGTPVVVSDAGGRDEVVLSPPYANEDRATGFLYPAGNAAELAQSLFKVLAMGPAARGAMGTRGRAFVAGRFSRQAFTERMLRVYAEVAALRPRALRRGH